MKSYFKVCDLRLEKWEFGPFSDWIWFSGGFQIWQPCKFILVLHSSPTMPMAKAMAMAMASMTN